MKNKYRTVIENVMELVDAFPEVKGNYNKMAMLYWVLYDKVEDLQDISKATPFSTIERAYRSLVADGSIKTKKRNKTKKAAVKSEFAALA